MARRRVQTRCCTIDTGRPRRSACTARIHVRPPSVVVVSTRRCASCQSTVTVAIGVAPFQVVVATTRPRESQDSVVRASWVQVRPRHLWRV